ncbi:iron-containing alcohol dehydrogenase [Donghicola sp. C2-DW-16]|uniref:Iron-containing alcohol dehydrogenase n=1 Tax=Donghicola mangrovi TaxID=2729614 RepID=A0ABX2PHA5_9RHOB|nr:iron-containing alcohol dehydrogenase [Donghicola mangrovi]NVO28788.1 iron-containing alcohol dehydrogenase [Donghicola mangrovi]
MMQFALAAPARIEFGRGKAALVAPAVAALGQRVLLVRGRSVDWADQLERDIAAAGAAVTVVYSAGEPDLPLLLGLVDQARAAQVDVVVGVGGGSTLDLAKALAALVPAPAGPMRYLEVVGEGKPLEAAPLPYVAVPTTSGTGAEVTKNAVIGIPEAARKVSLRDDRMLADLAVIDPALTDGCPRSVTLASGLDAVVQVIEPYLSSRATVLTDALCREAIPRGLSALVRLMQAEDPTARDDLALTSVYGGLALANAGLGAVHGVAGVLGGTTGIAHGVLCGRFLCPVLRDHEGAEDLPGATRARLAQVKLWIGQALSVPEEQAIDALEQWMDAAGLPRLADLTPEAPDAANVASASAMSSSMKGNPVTIPHSRLTEMVQKAFT